MLVLDLLRCAGLLYAIATSISRPLKRSLAIVAGVANGDLAQSIEGTSTDEVSRLPGVPGRMNGSLAGIVNMLKSSTEGVSIDSIEIASGNLDLSSRTETQACSLQRGPRR